MQPNSRLQIPLLLGTLTLIACTPNVDVPASEASAPMPNATTSASVAPEATTSAPLTPPQSGDFGSSATPAATPTPTSAPSASVAPNPIESDTGATPGDLSTTTPTADSSGVHDPSNDHSETPALDTSEQELSSDVGEALPALQPSSEPISFGTTLEAAAVMTASRQLAQAQSDPTSASWRAKGDQHRTYHFDATNNDEPYRLYVPMNWDGQAKLPLVMFLHGSGSNENTYLDQNNGQMIALAREHGVLLVAPLGAAGAYGNFLRLSAPFGNQQAADELIAQITPESRRSNELSEMDLINVLELVLAEYPVDRSSLFLTGHSMGSGGTWYIGGKYSTYWRAIAPMSGPFVQETGYPWDNLNDIAILVTEGTQTPSLYGSRQLGAWLSARAFDVEYKEVNADHGGMVPLVLPDVFGFFASTRGR